MARGSNNAITLWVAFLAGAACALLARYVFDYARASAQNAAAVAAAAAVVVIFVTVAAAFLRT